MGNRDTPEPELEPENRSDMAAGMELVEAGSPLPADTGELAVDDLVGGLLDMGSR